MIIDHEKKYVFVAIPKTGSISVQFSLGHTSIPEPHLYHQKLLPQINLENAQDYFKFAFVRNPWARLLSLYHDFTKNRIDKYSAQVTHDKPLLSEFKDFEDLCINLHNSNWRYDLFFWDQTEFLGVNGQVMVDYVGKFENFAEEFKHICKQLDINVELQKMNVGKYDNTKYREYYSTEATRAVARLYHRDIENFGYEF